MNNYLDVQNFNGMKVFKVFRDADGMFMDAPKYVAFRHNTLCGYYDSQRLAEQGFLKGDSTSVRLENFEGIDARLRR